MISAMVWMGGSTAEHLAAMLGHSRHAYGWADASPDNAAGPK
jgi:hypothetical protein